MRLCGVVVRPCRTIKNTSIAALPESFGSLSNLIDLCVRRHRMTGCGTGLWVHAGAFCDDAMRRAIGCAWATS
jgi:hypothetical protein